MPRGILMLVVAVELAVFMGSMIAWSFALARKSRGQPFYPYESRRPVPWGLSDLALLAFVALTATVIVSTIARSFLATGADATLTDMKSHTFALLILADSTVSLTVIGAAILFLRWRVGAGLHDFGVEPANVDSDVGLGMMAFVMLAVPVFMIQIWLMWLLPKQDQHPLVEKLKEDGSPQLLLVSIFVAVIVAPIVEEYFFRVLLQGWLENVACQSKSLHGLLFGGDEPSKLATAPAADFGVSVGSSPEGIRNHAAEDGPPDEPVFSGPPESDVTPSSAEAADNPYASPLASAAVVPEKKLVGSSQMRPRHWPIFVSAGLFAAMHLGNGYDPIPLFFLAVGLGYLYQQTHRVIPCIVVHLLLNATSIAVLWLTITYGVGG